MEHLARQTEELIDGERPIEEAKRFGSKRIGVGRGCEVPERGRIRLRQDEDGDPGQAGMKFGDEGGPADALHGMGSDHESEPVGELRLFDEAESLGCIGDADNLRKLPLQEGLPQESLEWIAFHD